MEGSLLGNPQPFRAVFLATWRKDDCIGTKLFQNYDDRYMQSLEGLKINNFHILTVQIWDDGAT